MSLLSSFISNQLLKALEAEFASHIPEIQQAIAFEAQSFANKVLEWVESKLNIQPPAPE